MQAVILAGGRGERLRPFTDEHPKPMYPIGGKPFIDRLMEQLRDFGIGRALLLLGYRADEIMEHLGDGSAYGLAIDYEVTPEAYETGDRLRHALPRLEERFLLMYCDNYCPIDYERLVRESEENGAMVQLSAYANRDGYTRSNLRLTASAPEEGGQVEVYDKTRTAENLRGVDLGYAIVRREVVADLPDMPGNFAKAVFARLAQQGQLYATVTEHRYYSIGSYERIALTEEFFREKRAVFLDRDGTINVRPPKACYVERPEDFIWLPGAIEAIRMLNDRGIITILISNQPGVVRGRMTMEDLEAVNEKLRRDLAAQGAHIDKIYYCLHNWDDGCFCRKPKPGLLYQGQRELSLDLTKCMLFGDDERDIAAADAARCPSELVSEEHPLIEAVRAYCAGLEREKGVAHP